MRNIISEVAVVYTTPLLFTASFNTFITPIITGGAISSEERDKL